MAVNLTDKQVKRIRDRIAKVGTRKVIDRLEGDLVNANLQGKVRTAARLEASIEFVRKQNDWVISV